VYSESFLHPRIYIFFCLLYERKDYERFLKRKCLLRLDNKLIYFIYSMELNCELFDVADNHRWKACHRLIQPEDRFFEAGDIACRYTSHKFTCIVADDDNACQSLQQRFSMHILWIFSFIQA